jgi:hypothetical protein
MNEDDARSAESAVHRLLMDRGAPEALVQGGLPGLMEAWEGIVASVEREYPLGLDDFLNDMDLRDLLAAALPLAGDAEGHDARRRVAALDDRLRAACVATACLWGEDVEEEEGLDPGREWWYYLRPLVLNQELAQELETWGLLADAQDDEP